MNRKRPVRFFSLVAIVLFCLFPDAAAQEALNVTETRLAIAPEGYSIGQVVFSPDGKNVAFAAGKKGKWHLFYGNRKGKPYDYVAMIAFSPDGRRTAYSARKGSKEYCVVDEREGNSFDSVCNPTFSRGGQVVFEASIKGKYFIAATRSWEGPRRDMSVIRPVFSPDGRRVFYILSDDTKSTVSSFIANSHTGDVIRSKTYDKIHSVSVSADGSWLAYGVKKDGKQRMILTDFTGKAKKSPAYERVANIVFSPDGKGIAWIVKHGGERFVISSSIAMKRFRRSPPFTSLGKPVFSPEGAYLLYTAASGKKMSWMLQPVNSGTMKKAVKQSGVPAPPRALSINGDYETVDSVVFSPDGSSFVYRGTRNGKYYMALRDARTVGQEEQESPAYDFISNIKFSPDGRHVAWLAKRKDSYFAVVGNAALSKIRKSAPYDRIWSPRFSPDGKQVLYGARSGRELWWKVEPLH